MWMLSQMLGNIGSWTRDEVRRILEEWCEDVLWEMQSSV